MRVYGVHRGRVCNPPQLRSLEHLGLRSLSELSAEMIPCATLLLSFLDELEGLERGNDVEDEQNFICERDTTLKVIYAWLRWIIIPIRSEIHRRSQVLASTKKQSPLCVRVDNRLEVICQTRKQYPLLGRLIKLDKKIDEIKEKITLHQSAGDLETVRNKMPVASPWEALVSCMLGAKAYDSEDQIRRRLAALTHVNSVAKKANGGGQPRMLHLILNPPDIPVSQGDGLIAILGSTSPNWKSPLLQSWAESSRRQCLLQRERFKYKRHRRKGPEHLQKLRTNGQLPGSVRRSETQLRVQAIQDCRSIRNRRGTLVYLEASGSNARAVAIDFPERGVRNRCFTCRVSTNWNMYLEPSEQDAMKAEVARHWNILENAEMQCAEVETGVEMERLMVGRFLGHI